MPRDLGCERLTAGFGLARFQAFVNTLFAQNWVVYAKPSMGSPRAVLRYLGRYTHRVAISNHRPLAFDGEKVTFRWKDSAHCSQWPTMALPASEFCGDSCNMCCPAGSCASGYSDISPALAGQPGSP
jgi:hypothetical protein